MRYFSTLRGRNEASNLVPGNEQISSLFLMASAGYGALLFWRSFANHRAESEAALRQYEQILIDAAAHSRNPRQYEPMVAVPVAGPFPTITQH